MFDIFFKTINNNQQTINNQKILIQNNLKQGTTALHCIYNFVIIHRSLLKTIEIKPVSLYKTRNLLYETKVIGVIKLFKSYVKTKSFSMGHCKHEQKKYIISYETSVG